MAGLSAAALLSVATLVVPYPTVALSSTDHEREVAASLLAAVIAFIVFAIGEPTLYQRYAWVPMGFPIALVSLHRRPLMALGMTDRG